VRLLSIQFINEFKDFGHHGFALRIEENERVYLENKTLKTSIAVLFVNN
jgi:hypothetical protein